MNRSLFFAAITFAAIASSPSARAQGECPYDPNGGIDMSIYPTCRPNPQPTNPSYDPGGGSPPPYYGGGGPTNTGGGYNPPSGSSGPGGGIVTPPNSFQIPTPADMVSRRAKEYWVEYPSGSIYETWHYYGPGMDPKAVGYAWCYIYALDNLEIFWFSSVQALDRIQTQCAGTVGGSFGYVLF